MDSALAAFEHEPDSTGTSTSDVGGNISLSCDIQGNAISYQICFDCAVRCTVLKVEVSLLDTEGAVLHHQLCEQTGTHIQTEGEIFDLPHGEYHLQARGYAPAPPPGHTSNYVLDNRTIHLY